jgi:hypothetical protein
MTDFNGATPGDKVKVTWTVEGTVEEVQHDEIGLRIERDTRGRTYVTFPTDAKVEIIKPPVKVGDVIEDPNDLPYGSVVGMTYEANGDYVYGIYAKWHTGWYVVGHAGPVNDPLRTNPGHKQWKVLQLPEGE